MRIVMSLVAAVVAALTLSACTPEEIVQANLVAKFGPDAGAAQKIAQCESGLDPSAVSPGGGNHGLFQINTVHRANFTRVTGQPWSPAVYDPHWNSMYAKWLYDQQGWGPWSCRRVL